MLLGARHVPERLCGGPCLLQRGAITSVRPSPFTILYVPATVLSRPRLMIEASVARDGIG